jgi:hypothetical protein
MYESNNNVFEENINEKSINFAGAAAVDDSQLQPGIR